jgi:hypothetical protein
MANLKPFLDSTKIALEKEASDKFGAAVETFSRGVLGPALGQPQPLPGGQVPFNRGDGSFYASSYAHALAGGTSYRPKLKFLFKVEFVFTPEAVAAFPTIFGGAKANDFTFMVKSVDRPKIDFEYEDDVNMYNFRTKVLKRIRHRELTITFMDDTGNRVLNFFRALMMLQSPITRRQLLREGTTRPPDPNTLSTGNGMMFSAPNDPKAGDNAIRGVTDSQVGNVISAIRVKQMFVDPGSQLGGSAKEVIYDFLNARIVSFDLDDLNHETSDVSLMTMQFDYDWMEIVDVGAMTTMDGPAYSIAVPGVGGAPVDMSVNQSAQTQAGGGSPFANIITNQVGRAAQSISSTAISRAVQSVAGKGRFASLIGSQASNILGGVIGAAARDLASGMSTAVNQGAVRAYSATVIDSAEGGPTAVSGVTRSADLPSAPPVVNNRHAEAAEETGQLVTSSTGHVTWVPDSKPAWGED